MSLRLLFAAVAVAPLLFVSTVARADLSSCGNIDVRANARCKVVVKDCDVQCTPINVTAACAARGQISCDAECKAKSPVTVECTGSCEADCNTRCNVNPGSLDCDADCSASCDGSCSAQCSGESEADGARGRCTASCRGNCSAQCTASCTGTRPTADCSGKCTASCRGRCTAEVTNPCQIDCQSNLRVTCEADVQGGCRARCSNPKGALFCDGQFVDTGNNLENCIDALRAELNIQVDASGSADCTGNTCTAEGEVSVSGCSTSRDSGMGSFAPIGVALAATASVLGRRRRDKKA